MNSFTLKIIAAASMLLDHIGYMFVPGWSPYRVIGRLAFPIFAFLIVEGALHTRDFKKYVSRIAIFALISEIPYDLAIFARPLYWGQCNILVTFLIGLLCIKAMQKLLAHFNFSPVGYAMGTAVFLGGAAAARLLHTDYDIYGVMLIYVFYVFRDRKVAKTLLAILVFATMPFLYFPAAASLVLIWFYNDERGYNPAWLRWGFYLFYPVHLIILYIVRMMTL